MGGVLIKITRPGVEPYSKAEQYDIRRIDGMNRYYAEIINDGTPDRLCTRLKDLIRDHCPSNPALVTEGAMVQRDSRGQVIR